MLKEVGKRIRSARELKDISQKKLGLTLGLSDKAISSYESGRTYPPLETLYQIAKELDKSIEYFIGKTSVELEIEDKLIKVHRKSEEIFNELKEIKKLFKNNRVVN